MSSTCQPDRLRHALGVARGPFLLLTPATLSLAFSWSWMTQAQLPWLPALLTLLAALCAHIAVNAHNEVHDFCSGLDLATARTPFSGGSGSLPGCPDALPLARLLAWGTTGATAVLGAALVYQQGSTLLPWGVVGLLLVLLYSGPVNRSPLLCLVSPGLGFGLIMVAGSAAALGAPSDIGLLALALMSFFLTNNLLLLNQLPDIEADRQHGRNHLMIQYGPHTGAQVFLLQGIAAYAVIAVAVISGHLPVGALLGYLTLPLFLKALQAFRAEQPEQRLPAMGSNVACSLLTPVMVSLGLLL